jgi:hypothetical protein
MLNTKDLFTRLTKLAEADKISVDEELALLITRRELEVQLGVTRSISTPAPAKAKQKNNWTWTPASRRHQSKTMKEVWARKREAAQSAAVN